MPIDPLSQRLIRILFAYGCTRRVLFGPARGMRFVVEPGIGATYALGAEAAAPRLFGKYVRLGMTVLDVGANKGQMALIFAALVGSSGRVMSLEPAPAEFSSLQRNLRLNGLQHVRAYQLAASDSETELAFLYEPARPTQGKLAHVEQTYASPGASVIRVATARLDTLVHDASTRPDFIKIDVEGAAAAVLRGAARILDEVGPVIYLELHGPEEQAGVRDELLSRGYVAETLDGRRVEDPVGSWHSPLMCFRH